MFGQNQKEKEADLEFFTVYDSKAKYYTEPFPAPNKDVLMRDFLQAFKHPEAAQKNRYYVNAEDFSVFKIAAFDKKTGEITPLKMEHVVNLHDLRSLSLPAALSPT